MSVRRLALASLLILCVGAVTGSLAPAPAAPPTPLVPPAPPALPVLCQELRPVLDAACGAPPECAGGYVHVAAQGPSCPAAAGWWVRLPDGAHVRTHGPDRAAQPRTAPEGGAALDGPAASGGGGGGSGAGSARGVVCVPPSHPHHVLVYAAAFDDSDRYATQEAAVRGELLAAGRFLYDQSLALGSARRLPVLCNPDGSVRVERAILPTPKAAAEFWSITGDLRDLGHDSPLAKYWVWYDDVIDPWVYGEATLCYDERLAANNCNNLGPTFGVSYSAGWDTMLHENGHTLGAVQQGAPHTSGAGHCNDDKDIMCYPDGGWNSGNYRSNVCATEQWDCNHDDYFHVAPAPGSYLASHWNLGSPLNRFYRVGEGQCTDGRDNDGDGLVDHPADPQCGSAADTTETIACQDGVDNDADGRADLGDDGCTAAADDDETGACGNLLDDDGDGAADADDRGCTDADDGTEGSDHAAEAEVFADAIDTSLVSTSFPSPRWRADPGSLWHASTGCVPAWHGPHHSPWKLAWTRSVTCTYDTGARTQGGMQTVAPVQLAGKTQATLSFVHVVGLGASADRIEVQGSLDGATWATLKAWDSLDADVPAWTTVHLDLDAYAGAAVWLRFHADSGDAVDNGHLGWTVDGIRVTAV